MKIGFAGIGRMGGPIALNLLAAGHELFVHARRRASADDLVARGAIWMETPAQLASCADLVFTALPGPSEVEAVVNGENGLTKGFRSGSGYIDMTTNSPSLVRQLFDELAAIGVSMLDAPVSGGPKGAVSKRLAIWVSGQIKTFETYKPVLEQIGDKVRFIGAPGNATIAKLVHNCASYAIVTALAEVFTLGVKAGVDPVTLFSAIRQATLGRQSVIDRLADQFLPGEFDPATFALQTAHKDVSLATALAREVGVPMRLANLTLAEMTEALNEGWGIRDSRSPMLLQERRAGVNIRVPREVLQQIMQTEKITL